MKKIIYISVNIWIWTVIKKRAYLSHIFWKLKVQYLATSFYLLEMFHMCHLSDMCTVQEMSVSKAGNQRHSGYRSLCFSSSLS